MAEAVQKERKGADTLQAVCEPRRKPSESFLGKVLENVVWDCKKRSTHLLFGCSCVQDNVLYRLFKNKGISPGKAVRQVGIIAFILKEQGKSLPQPEN